MPTKAYDIKLSALQSRMDYQFEDPGLLTTALTHSSYGDGQRKTTNYERLEFLGDRVLGLLTADMLYHAKDEAEGGMARRLNALVRKEPCARVARAIGVGEALLISASEDRQGGREKNSILGDACESILGAIYLDGGMMPALAFYEAHWSNEIEKVLAKSAKDPKTELQERASAEGGEPPVYSVLEQSGPDHRPLFVIEVSVENIGSARGTGKSKKVAERYAARHLLENWPLK
jgi:ribonuclease-3